MSRQVTISVRSHRNQMLVRASGLLFFLILPCFSHAATVLSGRVVTISSSTPDNAYIGAWQSSVSAPLPADLCAAAATLTVSAPIAGDALLAGGTIDLQKPVAGDVRAVAGKITVEDSVGGDLIAAAGAINVSGRAKDTRLVGGTVQLTNGSNGQVMIYGADVYLSGEFDGDVQVVASDHVSLAPDTVIHGSFKYNAPQQADIPSSVIINGGTEYIGSSPFLPTAKEAKTFATAGLWVFFLVRVTAVLVVVGLVAGLFPVMTDMVVERVLTRSLERFILLALLGFAGFVAVPFLLLFLVVSFVGIGIALLIGAAYFLFIMLAYAYGAVVAGAALMWWVRKDKHITWRGALLGALVLTIVGMIPVVGFVAEFVLAAAAGGALLSLFYRFAFRRELPDISEL